MKKSDYCSVDSSRLNILNEMATVEKTIDLVEGATILGSNEAIAKDMLQEFIISLPKSRSEIENAFSADNLEELIRVIHKFHGGLCYVGVPQLRKITKNLENALKRKDTPHAQYLYQTMLDEINAVERLFSTLD